MTTAIAQSKAKLLKQMTPATAEAAAELEVKYGKAATGLVLTQYDIGTRLGAIAADEAGYGNKAIEQLAEYLNIPGGPTGAYSLINFAATFDKKYVQESMATPMADGHFLTLGHWTMLGRLADEASRVKMLKRVLRDSLTANDLEREIRAGAGGEKANANQRGGRKPKVPSNPVVALQKTMEIGTKFCRWEESVTDTMVAAFDALAPDKVNKDTLSSAKKADGILEKVAEHAGTMRTELAKSIERIEGVLSARKAGKKATKAAEPEEEDDDAEEAPAPAPKKGVKKKAVAA